MRQILAMFPVDGVTPDDDFINRLSKSIFGSPAREKVVQDLSGTRLKLSHEYLPIYDWLEVWHNNIVLNLWDDDITEQSDEFRQFIRSISIGLKRQIKAKITTNKHSNEQTIVLNNISLQEFMNVFVSSAGGIIYYYQTDFNGDIIFGKRLTIDKAVENSCKLKNPII